jgi:hypothetical protein
MYEELRTNLVLSSYSVYFDVSGFRFPSELAFPILLYCFANCNSNLYCLLDARALPGNFDRRIYEIRNSKIMK